MSKFASVHKCKSLEDLERDSLCLGLWKTLTYVILQVTQRKVLHGDEDAFGAVVPAKRLDEAVSILLFQR